MIIPPALRTQQRRFSSDRATSLCSTDRFSTNILYMAAARPKIDRPSMNPVMVRLAATWRVIGQKQSLSRTELHATGTHITGGAQYRVLFPAPPGPLREPQVQWAVRRWCL